MDNNSPNQRKIYRSDEIIDSILKSLGLQRTDSSEYKTYTVDGKLLRVRVSDHGVNLSSWYRNNQGEEIPLNDSDNIAFTFLPNREECAERGEEFRTTAINKTTVYSDAATMTPIDFKFTVMHYIYQSWKFTEERLQALVSKIVEYTNSGKFEDPLHNTSAKATVFNDTSNNKPKKINCNTNMNKKLIRLTESDLHRIVKESVNKIINEIGDTYDGYKMLGRLQNKKAYIDNDDNAVEQVRNYRHNILKHNPEFAKKDKEIQDFFKRLHSSGDEQFKKQAIAKLKEGRGFLGGLVNTATEKFNEFYITHKDACISHINAVKESGEFNDLENRLAWDFARATRYQDWMPRDEQGYPVGNDAQKATLFKQALRNSAIEY